MRATGGVLTLKSYQDDFRYTDKTTVSAVMVSLQNVGAFLAAVAISFVSARFGRRRTIMASCAVFTLGVILQAIPSHSLACFYVGRFVSGLGLGAATAVALRWRRRKFADSWAVACRCCLLLVS